MPGNLQFKSEQAFAKWLVDNPHVKIVPVQPLVKEILKTESVNITNNYTKPKRSRKVSLTHQFSQWLAGVLLGVLLFVVALIILGAIYD